MERDFTREIDTNFERLILGVEGTEGESASACEETAVFLGAGWLSESDFPFAREDPGAVNGVVRVQGHAHGILTVSLDLEF